MWARAVRSSKRWMIPISGVLAIRSRCSVQIQQDPLLVGYVRYEKTQLYRRELAECQVLSKQYGEFKEFVRHSRGRCLVANGLYSFASFDVCIIVQQRVTHPYSLPHPMSRDYFLIPLVMGFSLRLALVYGMLEDVNTGRSLKCACAVR